LQKLSLEHLLTLNLLQLEEMLQDINSNATLEYHTENNFYNSIDMWNKYEFKFIDISKVTDFEFWIVSNFPQIQEDIEDVKLRLHNIAKSKSGF